MTAGIDGVTETLLPIIEAATKRQPLATPPAPPSSNTADADNNGVPDVDVAANDRANFLRAYEATQKARPDDPWVAANAAAYDMAKKQHSTWLAQATTQGQGTKG